MAHFAASRRGGGCPSCGGASVGHGNAIAGSRPLGGRLCRRGRSGSRLRQFCLQLCRHLFNIFKRQAGYLGYLFVSTKVYCQHIAGILLLAQENSLFYSFAAAVAVILLLIKFRKAHVQHLHLLP